MLGRLWEDVRTTLGRCADVQRLEAQLVASRRDDGWLLTLPLAEVTITKNLTPSGRWLPTSCASLHAVGTTAGY